MGAAMHGSSKPTHVEFDNPSPDTIEVRPASIIDVQNLSIPDEAVMFRFVKAKANQPPEPASPTYYLGHEFGLASQMAAKYPAYADQVSDWVRIWSVTEVGKMEWDFTVKGKRYAGYKLIPLTEKSILVRKDTREIVWPAPQNLP